MALIQCPECGSEISDLASNCPRCGFKDISIQPNIENSKPVLNLKQATPKLSKKTLLISISAALIVVIGLAVCFYFQSNPSLSKSDKEKFNFAEEAYKNGENLLAYSLYAQLPDYEKASERMNSIEMPSPCFNS